MRHVWLPVAILVAAALIPVAATAAETEPVVMFEDQRTTGRIVLVDAVQLPEPGWVVLHEPSPDGEGLGDFAGHSTMLSAGLHEDVPVTLSKNLSQPQTYIAVLYDDANGNKALDTSDGHAHQHEGEDRVYMEDGKPIGDQAEVSLYEDTQDDVPAVNPLVVGAATALAGVLLWAVRYR